MSADAGGFSVAASPVQGGFLRRPNKSQSGAIISPLKDTAAGVRSASSISMFGAAAAGDSAAEGDNFGASWAFAVSFQILKSEGADIRRECAPPKPQCCGK